MKSVKNFFIERINSIDNSENNSNASSANVSGRSSTIITKPQQLNKLKNIGGSFKHCVGGTKASAKALNSNASTIDDVASPSSIFYVDVKSSPTSVTNIEASTVPSNASTPVSAVGIGMIENSQLTSQTPKFSSNSNINTTSSVDGNLKFNFKTVTENTDVHMRTDGSSNEAHVSSSISAPIIKPPKGRRKISLPWFRQSSTTSHGSLSRQYTIDSVGSFRLFRQKSNHFKVGTQEVTWVVSDYVATPGTNELSVSKGQQVEIVETQSGSDPDFCLVRLNPQTDDAPVQEGIVPISILKPLPASQKNNSSRKDNSESIPEQSNSRCKPDPLTSSTKRRGFSGRKWLPQPLRKLSQSKVEKPPTEKSFVKKASEKNLRLPQKQPEYDEDNVSSTTTSDPHTTGDYSVAANSVIAQHNTSQQDFEAEEEAGLELPPPMKPIQDPHLMSNGPPAFTKDLKENSTNLTSTGKMDGNPLSEIEQIVKEKTEQHEEKSKFFKPNFDTGGGTESNGRVSSGVGELDLCYPHNNSNATDNNDENNTESNDIDTAQKKRMCALTELVSTEELYIQDLSEIVNGYIGEMRNPNSEIPLPDDLKSGKERMVFGNIEAIYEWHRDFFVKALQRCQKTPAELGPMIKRYERKFHMYIVYCQNKPVSEHIVSEHFSYFDQIRQKLRHRLDLSDLLIKPVQRITKYELLLKEITKQTERAGLLEEVSSMEESFHVMKVVCKAVNDMMVLRRLQKFEGKITAQGKLLLHGPLTCIEDAKSSERNACMVQKPRELQVFLFEQSIIFSDIVGKKTQFTSPSYIYRSHIQVNKMQLEEMPNNRFLLKSTDPNRPDLNMICYAATIELNHEWLDTIRNILQSQHDFLKAITSPIQYQKELTKES